MKKRIKPRPPRQPGSTLLRGFRYQYPQTFLDDLAKAMGIKWSKSDSFTIPSEEIEVRLCPPPSGKLYYCDFKYKEDLELIDASIIK